MAIAGAGVQWLRDNLGIIQSSSEVEPLAASVPDTAGVYFVPAFSGLFAPRWRPDARGVCVGLTQFSTKAHIARALLEAICFQTRDVLEAMQLDASAAAVAKEGEGGGDGGDGLKLARLRVDGGATANGGVNKVTSVPFCCHLSLSLLTLPVFSLAILSRDYMITGGTLAKKPTLRCRFGRILLRLPTPLK